MKRKKNTESIQENKTRDEERESCTRTGSQTGRGKPRGMAAVAALRWLLLVSCLLLLSLFLFSHLFFFRTSCLAFARDVKFVHPRRRGAKTNSSFVSGKAGVGRSPADATENKKREKRGTQRGWRQKREKKERRSKKRNQNKKKTRVE
jgi:hypothetical protein